MKLTSEIAAVLNEPLPKPACNRLASVRDEIWIDGNYALVVCGADPEERQRIARRVWAELQLQTGNLSA